MTHPIDSCDPAKELMLSVWKVSPIIHLDPLQPNWYLRVRELAAELQSEPEYRVAMGKYKAHVSECESCKEGLDELNAIE